MSLCVCCKQISAVSLGRFFSAPQPVARTAHTTIPPTALTRPLHHRTVSNRKQSRSLHARHPKSSRRQPLQRLKQTANTTRDRPKLNSLTNNDAIAMMSCCCYTAALLRTVSSCYWLTGRHVTYVQILRLVGGLSSFILARRRRMLLLFFHWLRSGRLRKGLALIG